jgi:hypothetical protein
MANEQLRSKKHEEREATLARGRERENAPTRNKMGEERQQFVSK